MPAARTHIILIFSFISLLFINPILAMSQSPMPWDVILGQSHMNDRAIAVAMRDLQELSKAFGLQIQSAGTEKKMRTNSIIVGSPKRNALTRALVNKGQLALTEVDDPEGYEIVTTQINNHKVMVIAGGSILGDVYGLYWLQDRIKVFRAVPNINVTRVPSLKVRYTRVDVRTKEAVNRALRYGLNVVYISNVLNLVPWSAEPEKTENQRYREKMRKLIQYAHALHLKVLAFGTDFTYHPSLLEEFGATLSPCDPIFWDAVQAKYRLLLQAMPELDGIATFTGEEQRFWGNYRTFDPIHDGEGCDWSLEKRYRTFIKKVHSVVVGEFNKIYHHRTWITNCYEQQSRPEVYRKIFTKDVPTKNLYLIPSFTQNDRWWHQRYNPTFNQTPHSMLAVLEPMNYYESSKSHLFATYSGTYFQAGLQSILEAGNSNLEGGSFDLHRIEDYNTASLTAYTVFRLGWDFRENPRQITKDFCAIHFGREVAEEMAEIYLLSPVAYKYGLWIEPVAYGEFNSLPHVRVGTFPAQGYPSIDNGKAQVDFWRHIFLRCKPWLEETLDDLDHGLEIANKMCEKFNKIKPKFEDVDLAIDLENRLEMTRLLIKTNNLYVKTAFAYFRYRDDPTVDNKRVLGELLDELTSARAEFMSTPNFGYQLFGVNQIIINAQQALDDLYEAERMLDQAPSAEQIENTVRRQQKRYADILESHAKDAVKFLHFEGQIDGRDILFIHDASYEIEHLRWDPPSVEVCRFHQELPPKQVTVVPRDIQSRPLHPFILEQPSEHNNFTAKIYLYDVPGGRDWVKFDLYFIDQKPENLGLKIPWNKVP